jgi:hypothetical protein
MKISLVDSLLCSLVDAVCYHEDGGSRFLRKVCKCLPDYITSQKTVIFTSCLFIYASHLTSSGVCTYFQGFFFLAVHARTAFQNLFEGTNFHKSKNKIINKGSVPKFKEFSKLAHYLQPSH